MMRSNVTIRMAKYRQQEHSQMISASQALRGLRSQGTLSEPAEKSQFPGLALGIMIFVLLLLGTGCTLDFVMAAGNSSSGEAAVDQADPFALKTEHLAATWRVYDKGYPSFLRLNSDHTFQRAHTADMPADEILDFGEWQFDGDLLTLSSDEAITNCNGNPEGQYKLWTQPYDGIFFFQKKEMCEGRLGFGWEPDYAPIQLAGKLCRVDSVAFCDSFVGYEPEEVVQPNAPRLEDKVVAPPAAMERAAERDLGITEPEQVVSEKDPSFGEDAPNQTENFLLKD